MFKIGDLVHFAHLSGKEPGEIELKITPEGPFYVRWPDHSGSWHPSNQLRHAFAAYNPNQADADTPPRRKYSVGDLVEYAADSGPVPAVVCKHDQLDGWYLLRLLRGDSWLYTCPERNISPYEWPRDADTPPRRKPRYTLLPWDVLDEVSQVFAVGAAKYSPHDWAKPDNGGGDHLEAALRHIVAHMRGDTFDDPALGGSGLRHLSHAAARVLMCIGKEIRNQ